MKLTYETGTATLIQFITLSLLNILTGLDSVATTCRKEDGDCLGDFLISFIFYLLVVFWFGVVCVLGYGAQQRRSKLLARLLIAAEVMIAMVALFNIKLNLAGSHSLLSLFTSIVDLILAIWIISLAFRLMKAGSGRVVAKQRPRRRQKAA